MQNLTSDEFNVLRRKLGNMRTLFASRYPYQDIREYTQLLKAMEQMLFAGVWEPTVKNLSQSKPKRHQDSGRIDE